MNELKSNLYEQSSLHPKLETTAGSIIVNFLNKKDVHLSSWENNHKDYLRFEVYGNYIDLNVDLHMVEFPPNDAGIPEIDWRIENRSKFTDGKPITNPIYDFMEKIIKNEIIPFMMNNSILFVKAERSKLEKSLTLTNEKLDAARKNVQELEFKQHLLEGQLKKLT